MFKENIGFNTFRPRPNGRCFVGDIFKYISMYENCCILIQVSNKFVPRVPLTIICHWLHNGMAPYRRQSINWIGDEPVHWSVYASQGRKGLIAQTLYISTLLQNYQLDVLCYALKAKRCHDADAKFAPVKKLFASRQPVGFRMLGLSHDGVIKWKHFPRYWPFVRGIHRSPVNSPHKGQWRGALMFSFIYIWVNGWVNNRKAGDLRRYRAHYDVSVMPCSLLLQVPLHLLAPPMPRSLRLLL